MAKTLISGLMIFLTLVLLPTTLAAALITVDYGDITADGYYVLDPGADRWDLTLCDLEVKYTLDMAGYVPADWPFWCSAVGVGDGAWIFLNHCAPEAAETDPGLYDLDDKLNFAFTSGDPECWSEICYNATGPETVVTPPIGDPTTNFGIWFDRDGIDPSQASDWGMIDGVTYNTAGVYDIVLKYHAIDGTHGTAFATVNGQQQGFYDAVSSGPPDYWPVGLGFYGDLTRLRVIANVIGGNQVSDLQATGCRYGSEPEAFRYYLPFVVKGW